MISSSALPEDANAELEVAGVDTGIVIGRAGVGNMVKAIFEEVDPSWTAREGQSETDLGREVKTGCSYRNLVFGIKRASTKCYERS